LRILIQSSSFLAELLLATIHFALSLRLTGIIVGNILIAATLLAGKAKIELWGLALYKVRFLTGKIGIAGALRRIGCSLLAATVLMGCEIRTEHIKNSHRTSGSTKTKAVISDSLRKALAQFNRGAGSLEQYRYAEAARAFETVLDFAPDWSAARFNLGLAYFNMQEQPGAKSYLANAQEAFETVLQSNSDHLHARFCLGLYYQHVGDNEKALECFRAVHQADSTDSYVAYKYAEVLVNVGRNEEAMRLLERVVTADPGFVSAVYRLATQYQRDKQRDKAQALFKRFRELKDIELTGGTFTVLKAYGTVGKYYMALGADDLPLAHLQTPLPTRILFSPELKALKAESSVWPCPGGTVGLPGLAAGDIDDDGDIDLCISSLGSSASTSLWLNDGSGGFSLHATLAQRGISPCFGDVDNDGDIDLWLGCAGRDMYFQNDGKGNFEKSEVPAIGGENFVTPCARLLDIDSDGDLDLLALRFRRCAVPATEAAEPAASSLYNNNRDGSFVDVADKLGLAFPETAISAAVYDDFDNDRDLDLVVFPTSGPGPVSWVNDRVWKYRMLDAETTGLSVTGVLSATSGDPDKDGDRDLLVFTVKGLHLFVNQGNFRFERHLDFSRRHGQLGGTGGQFADMDNDGDLDVVVADGFRPDGSRGPALLINDWPRDHFVNVLKVDPGHLFGAITIKADASCVVADFTGNGRCDVLLAPAGQKPFLMQNITAGGHWIEIDLAGTRGQDKKSRSNNSAVGARVEVKTGTISQQYVVGMPSGPVAMPPYRIHAGLGQYGKVDWLRIMWPDAVLQAELELAADQVMTVTELQRKTSSCPHLFAWDGSHFEFISDFAGMGGIGYLMTPGVYARPDPTEYLPIPHLEPRQGQYIFQVLEPVEEVVYFDEAKLIAVDHPTGTEVWPHEMMAVNAPPPPFELFCFRDTIEPVRAVDHRGVDVTDKIRAVDRRYAGATEPDPRFVGYAKDHFVELDFADRLQAVPACAAPEGVPGGRTGLPLQRQESQSRLVLFVYGWVEYPYSATNFAASQANMRLHPPSVHVFREGTWVELFHEIGYPGGIRHMMTLDVTGKVLPGDQRIRISSNMELYWDRIFIAIIPPLRGDRLYVQEVPVKNANLHFLGYPREYSPDGRHPNLYDYDNVDRTVPWKIMDGDYTRYGDVTELLEKADDCYVVMGRGEELTVCFSADALGPVAKGCRRSFILKTDSFCKDMDLYSAYPDTVEPLPFHGMSNYPYGPNEKYPDDEKRRQYRQRFNTRRVHSPGN
jgi:tetratricopeptide (TPR) repeat protein